MALAPLSVVQVVLAGGVVLVGVMAERLFGFTVGPPPVVGLALTAAGLVVFALTVPATTARTPLLAGRDDRVRGGALRPRRPADRGPPAGAPARAPRRHARRGRRHAVRRLRHLDQGAHRHRGRARRARRCAQPVAGRRHRRVGRRLLRLRKSPAGRRGGPCHRDHRRDREHLGDRRGVLVLRRPAAERRRSASSRRSLAFCGHRRGGADARAHARRRGRRGDAPTRRGRAGRPAGRPLGAFAMVRGRMPTTSQLVRKGAQAAEEEARHAGPEVRQGPQAQGRRAAAPRRLHARLHDDAEEAELGAAQGRARAHHRLDRGRPPTSPARATTCRSTRSCSCAAAASRIFRACATRWSAARSTPPASPTARRRARSTA